MVAISLIVSALIATIGPAVIGLVRTIVSGRAVIARRLVTRRLCSPLQRARFCLGGSICLLFFGGRIVARQVQQEYAALAVFQILTKVDTLVMRLTRVGLRKRLLLLEALNDMVFAETVHELGMAISALIEADQMLQLVG